MTGHECLIYVYRCKWRHPPFYVQFIIDRRIQWSVLPSVGASNSSENKKLHWDLVAADSRVDDNTHNHSHYTGQWTQLITAEDFVFSRFTDSVLLRWKLVHSD